jgi:hypothetical protein
MVAQLLEWLGIRGFYWLMSRLAGERMLPPVRTSHAHGWSLAKVAEIKEGSRYFLTANIFRGVVYIPPALGAWGHFSWIPLSTMGFIVLFHSLCIILEAYKHQLCQAHSRALSEGRWPEEEAKEPPDIRLSSKTDWYFAPRRWESEKLYRALGMFAFQQMVTYYIDNTRLTKEERKRGKKAVFLKSSRPDDTLQFVRDTRVAESIHLCAFFLNIPVFVQGVALQLPFVAGFVLPVLILDAYLVLLQRHHRLRMWSMIVRARADVQQA